MLIVVFQKVESNSNWQLIKSIYTAAKTDKSFHFSLSRFPRIYTCLNWLHATANHLSSNDNSGIFVTTNDEYSVI